jgi:hypothetical protein
MAMSLRRRPEAPLVHGTSDAERELVSSLLRDPLYTFIDRISGQSHHITSGAQKLPNVQRRKGENKQAVINACIFIQKHDKEMHTAHPAP